MKDTKKKFKDTKFGAFLSKASQSVPELLAVGGEILTGDIGGAVDKVGDILKGKAKDNNEATKLLQEFELAKMEYKKEVFALEVEDRESARKLYKDDNLIQKIFGIIFLVGYGFLSWYLLRVLMGNENLPKLAETMVTMIWTGTSTKLNTIIDFYFGGSV
jgi:hypothetical protein